MFGELSRMTQFKDKSLRNADNINAGLFTYPTLMAADILLYSSDLVPVGIDQKQHVELSRDIANRFNSIYGTVFVVPEPYIPKAGAKVMSLSEPTKKMSKSDENANGYILLMDKPEDIMRKFKRAVTDSDTRIFMGDNKDGVNNLINIYSTVTGKPVSEIEREFDGLGYSSFKPAVAEAVIETLRPVREKTEDLLKHKDFLESVYQNGALRASKLADRMVEKVSKKVGFVKRPYHG